MSSEQDRRTFLTAIASVTGLVALDGAAAHAAPAAQAPAAVSAKWDLSWADQFKGKHKQVYDYGSQDLSNETRPFRFVRNFIDTTADAYGIPPTDMNTAIGISYPSFPANASSAMWEKYKLGERWKINDPMTRLPSIRNIFLDIPSEGIKALQASGTVFWQCNVAFGVVVGMLARQFNKPAEEVRADLIAGFNPGVKLVPSHVFALGLTQERGFTYMKP